MIEQILKKVIEKHGQITIKLSDNKSKGNFYIYTSESSEKSINVYCFDLFTGLLDLLLEEKK